MFGAGETLYILKRELHRSYSGAALRRRYLDFYCNTLCVFLLIATICKFGRLCCMDTTLMFAQIAYYLTVALAVTVVGVLCSIVTYRLVRIARELEGLSRNLHEASTEVGEQIRDVVERLSDVPILSFFLRKRPKVRHEKGRRKLDKNK